MPTSLEVTRPSTIPHQDFIALSKEERRQLHYSNDIKLNYEGHRELNVGYWQSEFKVDDHGAVHGLEYTVKENGGTKTEKTEANTLKFMRSIADMPNRENIKWFDNGTYQGGTDPEHEELMETGNFGGSGQVKNLPPVTPMNSFENDIMGVTPIDNSQMDNS